MNIIDLLIVLITAVTVYTTFRKGFIKIVTEIVGFFTATAFAYYWFMDVGEMIGPILHLEAKLVYIISFTILWVLIFIASAVVGTLLQKAINKTFLKPFNIAASIILGLLKGVAYSFIFIIIPVIGISLIYKPMDDYLKESFTVKKLKPVIIKAGESMLPESLPSILDIKGNIEKLKQEKIKNLSKELGAVGK